MDRDKPLPTGPGRGVNYAPWERAFLRIISPFEDFIHRQTTSALLLMCCTVVALVFANSPFAEGYFHFLHLPAGIQIGDWQLDMSLHHWVNDGLMTLFFFVVGMELKREILAGELADLRQASLPIIAALGGMLVPAGVFLLFNGGTETARGWGIPMATDIAFAVGALVLLAARVPKALITFLVALAIADDLGAVIVIAVFYTQQMAWGWLGLSATLLAVLFALNFSGVRGALPYFLVTTLLWYALLRSGVHATLAGVSCALAIPAHAKYDPSAFSQRIRELMARFDASRTKAGNILANEGMQNVVETLERGVRGVRPPLQRLEHRLHLPVAFLVVPIFALFNAGIPLGGEVAHPLSHPVFQGVMLGLLLGKFVGITGACWLALRLGLGRLPQGVTFSQIAAVSMLCGIGFTMSIFIAEQGFAEDAASLLMAKAGVLAASVLGGLGGTFWLWWLSRTKS